MAAPTARPNQTGRRLIIAEPTRAAAETGAAARGVADSRPVEEYTSGCSRAPQEALNALRPESSRSLRPKSNTSPPCSQAPRIASARSTLFGRRFQQRSSEAPYL